MPILFPTSPTVGQVFTSGGRSWVWSGATWDSPTATNTLLAPYGLELIASVPFTAAASASFDNVFTSEYTNYKIIFDLDASGSGVDIRLRLRDGGVPTSTSSYRNGLLIVGAADSFGGAFTSTNSVTETFCFIARSSTLSESTSGDLTVYSPTLIRRTKMTSHCTGRALQVGGFETTVTTSFDGFEIFGSSGTLTGTIRVYGWRNS
jgi:hypothetical protein